MAIDGSKMKCAVCDMDDAEIVLRTPEAFRLMTRILLAMYAPYAFIFKSLSYIHFIPTHRYFLYVHG